MNWFYNLKIANKLLLSFMLVAVIAGVIGYIGISNISEIEVSDTEMYENMTVPIAQMSEISTYFQRMRVNTREVVMAQTDSEIENFTKRIQTYRDSIDAIAKRFEERIISDEMKNLWGNFISARKEYGEDLNHFFALARENRDAEAMAFINGDFGTSARAEMNIIKDIIDMKNRDASAKSDANTALAKTATTTMLIIMGVGIFLAVALGFFISRIISNPLKNLAHIADKLALGEVNVSVEAKTKDELGDLERSFALMIDNTKTNAAAADKIAQGDTSVEIKAKSEKDVLSNSMIKVVESIRSVIAEAVMLSQAGIEGQLSTRGNAAKFQGGYKDIVEGFNSVLDAVILPIQDGARVLEVMATGDLTVRVTKEYKGQHQNIKNSINKMGESIGAVISDVAEAVAAAASASTQISSSTEEMAAGAQEQSSQANEVAAAVEQMTTTILQSSKHASSTAQTAKSAGTYAREGGKVVKDTISGMGKIDEVVNSAAVTVRELGKSSDQIGEIVQVIDEIADQTNLLALNAAIEAARAGEQGRGFAVVADEVRKLAERTTKATKEIAGMIKKIQVDTSGAVESIGRGTEEVAKGRELATRAGESLEQIIKGAEEVVDLATQVASASEEQSSAAEQISKNIEAISSVTQQSAAGTQQIARAAEDLNRLTENLQSLINKFKIDDKKGSPRYGVRQNGKIVEV